MPRKKTYANVTKAIMETTARELSIPAQETQAALEQLERTAREIVNSHEKVQLNNTRKATHERISKYVQLAEPGKDKEKAAFEAQWTELTKLTSESRKRCRDLRDAFTVAKVEHDKLMAPFDLPA
jgi:hypothetical protein